METYLEPEGMGHMFSRETIEEMFDGMRINAQLNLSEELVWGYFFTAQDLARLQAAATILQKDGYQLVSIHQSDADNLGEPVDWWLHVEKTEHHTVDSLVERNAALEALAERFELTSYDGMDVGPMGGTVN
jgi:hypothetical protein